jgi:hypothetical protein
MINTTQENIATAVDYVIEGELVSESSEYNPERVENKAEKRLSKFEQEVFYDQFIFEMKRILATKIQAYQDLPEITYWPAPEAGKLRSIVPQYKSFTIPTIPESAIQTEKGFCAAIFREAVGHENGDEKLRYQLCAMQADQAMQIVYEEDVFASQKKPAIYNVKIGDGKIAAMTKDGIKMFEINN